MAPGSIATIQARGSPSSAACYPSTCGTECPTPTLSDPHFIALYRYSDLDALLELFGHLRATNPTSPVGFRAANQLVADDYTGHLVLLGGVDWNNARGSVLDRLQLPVRQVSRLDEDEPGDAYFEVTDEEGLSIIHRPWLDELRGQRIVREDVALFTQARPYNRKRFVTICNGMYGRGTLYGAVRALTDERFRDRNTEYLRETFGDSDAFCILSRVTVKNGMALTPDWTIPGDPALRMVQGLVMDRARTPDHHGSHRRLLWSIDESMPRARVDAIIVPTARTVPCLRQAAHAARTLGCPLVTLHSKGGTSTFAARYYIDQAVDLIAIDVPGSAHLRLPALDTSRL